MTHATGLQRPTLLYVENDPDDQLFFLRAAARVKADFSVQPFADLKAAQDYISGHGPFQDRDSYPFPVLVLLDYNLDGWCGVELLRWIRGQPEFAHLTIIMFSSSGQDGRFADCYRQGADHCVEKPMSMDGLEEVIGCLNRCITAQPMCFAELKTLSCYAANAMPDRILPAQECEHRTSNAQR